MNKKFSTLAASLLLASAFTTVSAQLKVGDYVRLSSAGAGVISINIDGGTGLPTGELKGKTGATSISGLDEDAIHGKITEAKAQIWKVAKATTLASGQKCYQFTNKLTNEYLAADLYLATETGRAIKLSAQGNRDWYEKGGVLYTYNADKDSTYALKATALDGDIVLTRVKGTNANGTAYTPDTNNPGITIRKALDFNALMSYKDNDKKLHFNGNNVSDGYTNILVNTEWKAIDAVETASYETFFLANGEKTSDNKNPYLLMVDHKSYTNTDTNFALTADTLAVDKTDAEKVAGGTYNSAKINAYMSFADGQNVETFARPIGAAQWTATYSLLNDSLALKPVKVPNKAAATNAYVSDGFRIVRVGANTTTIAGAVIGGVKGSSSTATELANLKAAVTKWLARLGNDLVEGNGYKLTFKNSYFDVEGGYEVEENDPYDTPSDGHTFKYGEDLITLAKMAVASNTGLTAAEKKTAEEFLEAAGYLKAFSTNVPGKYFERGVAHQAGTNRGLNDVVGLVKLLDKNVLTITASNAPNFVETMIQPYVSAPSGDAEITASAGLFFMKVENTDNKLRAASLTRYVVDDPITPGAPYDYQEVVDETNPYAQWVFIPNAAGSYSIVNRGTEKPYYSGLISVVKDENGKAVADTYVINGDTLKLGAVTLNTDNVYTEDKKQYDYSGFFYAGPQDGKTMSFAIAPVSPFMSSLAMQVQADSTVVLGDAENAPIWYFEEVKGTTYGAPIAGVPQLKSVGYRIFMKDENDVKYYIEANNTSRNFEITKHDSKATMDVLYFRTVAKDTYLITNGLTAGADKMTINPTPAQPIIEVTGVAGTRNDYFTVGKSSVSHYRTLTAEDGVNGNAAIYLNNETSRYLYENTANIVANNGTKFAKDSLNFLGIFNAFELDKNPTVYVDTAYVDREGNVMPQYMFALGVEDVPATAGAACTKDGVHVDKDGKLTTADKCVHATPATAGYKAGRYLVVLTDSTENKSAKYDGATRLAFVPAKHYLGQDSLVIDNSKWTGNTKVMTAGKADTYASKDTIKIENNKLKASTFALLIKDQADQSFYLQTVDDAAGKAQYVRILNGVPVLTNSKDDAAVFNIAASEEEATANEAIEAAGVQVIGGKGAVTVQGAAGKVITVANILGQTIANQVAASDNVTIAAPAGIVVVAVEGEATKVVVK